MFGNGELGNLYFGAGGVDDSSADSFQPCFYLAGDAVRPDDHLVAGEDAFQWDQIDPNWKNWTADQYRLALIHPLAKKGYASDMSAMEWADTCVLVLPCGRSAHLEAGWFAGKGKSLYILTRDGEEPELMANMATFIVGSQDELYRRLD